MGLVNGLVVHYFRVPTIIVTIATFNIYFGLMYVITRGKLINNIPQLFKDFGNVLLFPATSPIGGTYGLSLMPLLWLAALVLGWFILRRTFLGRSICAMGGNETAAERVGIRTMWTRVFVFVFVGLLSGIAAVVHVSIVQSVVPNIIVGKELEVIAAVVIGGASVFGGRGTLTGTFLGVLLFAILNNGLTLLRDLLLLVQRRHRGRDHGGHHRQRLPAAAPPAHAREREDRGRGGGEMTALERFSANRSLVIILAGIVILMSALNPQRFPTLGNLISMSYQLPIIAFLSIGMMVTMLSGGINLAIVATANFTGIVTVFILQAFMGKATADASVWVSLAGHGRRPGGGRCWSGRPWAG